MGSIKGFKVTDSERKVRIGIAARSLEELKNKTVQKWNLKVDTSQLNLQLSDGTLVDTEEYFSSLESQTLLIWFPHGKRAETDAELLYKTIRDVNDDFLTAGEKVQEFFTEKMKNKVYKLAEILRTVDNSKCTYSKKSEHPEWFEGLDTRSNTKEEYMYRRAQDRIRTYYYKTKDELLKNKGVPLETLQPVLIDLQIKLRNVDYYGCYFDRSKCSEECKLKCLCDKKGTFTCQGRWNKTACPYSPPHSINPYTSREERIIFQMWNLDHVIERTRSVIPAVIESLKKSDTIIGEKLKDRVSTEKIFRDLFTTNNLKLVHIVCHDKGRHLVAEPDSYLSY